MEKCGFWTIFWGQGDYIDVWMIKITVETNKIDMDVCFIKSR